MRFFVFRIKTALGALCAAAVIASTAMFILYALREISQQLPVFSLFEGGFEFMGERFVFSPALIIAKKYLNMVASFYRNLFG